MAHIAVIQMDTRAGKKSSFSHRVNLIALLKAIDPLIEVYDVFVG